MPRCEICRGEQTIRLPIHRESRVFSDLTDSQSPVPAVRSYPCPECAETVTQNRVSIVRYHSIMDAGDGSDPRFADYVRREAANAFGDFILESGFIQFERGPNDIQQMTFPTKATIGVVSPKHVATLEERIVERQMQIAGEVVTAAVVGITNWNSRFNGPEGSIPKDQAATEVREAMQCVTNRLAATASR